MSAKRVLLLFCLGVTLAIFSFVEWHFLWIKRETQSVEVELDSLKLVSEKFLVSPYKGHDKFTIPLTKSKLEVHLELSEPSRIFTKRKVGIRIVGGYLILERSNSITKNLPETWSPADIDTIDIFPSNSRSRVQAPMKVSKIAEEGAWRFEVQESQKMTFITYERQGGKHLFISVPLYAGSGLIGISEFGSSRQSTKVTGRSPFISVESNEAKMIYYCTQLGLFLPFLGIIVSILWKLFNL